MAETFFQVLIENLTSLIQDEIGLIMGVDAEMNKLSNNLTTLQKVLEDAEDKQFLSKSIQNWLSELNGISFEIEDILDECSTEVSKLKLKAGKFNLKKYLFKHKIRRRIKEAAEKLDALAKDRHRFQLQEIVVRQPNQINWRHETGSVLNEPDHIYGRDEEKERIVDILVKEVKDCENLSVLPIIGVGGLGKTTLAEFVYNDERVGAHFDTLLWVCVSDDFDLKAILKAITGERSDLANLDSLQRCIWQELNGKRYLLILDDVWNENQEDWARLESILACGSIGASVIVTTRLKKVADIVGTLPAHCLAMLPEEECWLLFKQRAFGKENDQHLNLETVGRRIAKKCGGVPLVAKALGGLLLFKREEREWIRVEESHVWSLPEGNSILLVLRLSYRHLPFVLKQCFAYCAVFPKDYEFDREELIFHWMAHGYILSIGKEEVEDVGDQILNGLTLRSFFQKVRTEDGKTTFKMHDLVHDLAQSIMENKTFGSKHSSVSVPDSKVRQVQWRKYSKVSTSSIAVEVSSLTTIKNYNRMRTLKLNGAAIEELPSAIGKLKHLRHLDLSNSSIRTLPRTFCCLFNLQILILNKLGDKIGNQLDELEHLNLGGTLEIRHLERVQNHKNANLVEKPNLRDLNFWWDDYCSILDLTKMMDDEKVLEALEPHPNLATLGVYGFQGRELATWMINMKNLTRIQIMFCGNCTHLSSLGDLPLLKFLILESLEALEYIVQKDDNECQNSLGVKFSSLEELRLYILPNLKGLLKEGEVGEMFPNLLCLTIVGCPLLILPSTFVSSTLKNLVEVTCGPLVLSSLPSNLENLLSLSLYLSKTDDNIAEDAFRDLCSLKYLLVSGETKQRLPEKWSRDLNSLAHLYLWDCKIPEGWLGHLTSLEDLHINECNELVDFAEEFKHLRFLKDLSFNSILDMISLPQGLR
ncbi:hypothetical protein ACS0TY_016254 [Phlomoides rotata]